MSIHDFLSTSMMILALMGVSAALELAVPLFAATGANPVRRRANLAMTAVTLVFNWGLISFAAWIAASANADGVMMRAGFPVAAQAVVGIVILDFAYGYLAHRLMHASPLLWKFHRLHHTDTFVDVTTTYRTHPVEAVWRYAFLMVPIRLLGIPASAVALYRTLSVVNAIFEHANIGIKSPVDMWLSRLWVTPNMHKVHHSRLQTETDSNYGNILSIHDRLLGTFTPTDRALAVSYGLDDGGDAAEASAARLLVLPFSDRRASISPARVA